MKKSSSLNARFEESLKKNWDRPALSDYHGKTLTYGEVAEMIAKIHIFFDSCGIQKGDKIALCSKNQANWTVAYLAILTYGAVVVPLLHEFKPGAIHHLVNHSDAKLLFIGNVIWENLNAAEMPELEAIITLTEFDVAYARKPEYTEFRTKVNEIFKEHYPDFSPKDIDYHEDKPEDLALISYTSGSTGFSKGVMLPYRSMVYNIDFAYYAEPQMNNQSRVVSMPISPTPQYAIRCSMHWSPSPIIILPVSPKHHSTILSKCGLRTSLTYASRVGGSFLALISWNLASESLCFSRLGLTIAAGRRHGR